MTVVCYETKKGERFLSYYTYKTQEEAQKEVNEMNRTKPTKLWNGEKVDWTKVEKFFVDDQEEMY